MSQNFDSSIEIGFCGAQPSESPTFAYILAMFLTRNGQQGNAPEMQAGIEQFMSENKWQTMRGKS